jgi:hypothetical protein
MCIKMHQLNLYQYVPPSVLITYEHMLTYHINEHMFEDGEGQYGLKKVLYVGTRQVRAVYHENPTVQL